MSAALKSVDYVVGWSWRHDLETPYVDHIPATSAERAIQKVKKAILAECAGTRADIVVRTAYPKGY